MSTFNRWCQHYGYDPQEPQSWIDYERYRAELALFDAIFAGDGS